MEERGYTQTFDSSYRRAIPNTEIIINVGDRTELIPMYKGVRQRCSLSSTLFNTYIDDVV